MMNIQEAREIFRQNGFFDDPGDAMLYGDPKPKRKRKHRSKHSEFLETLKSDNEKDNKVIDIAEDTYDEFFESLGVEPQHPVATRLKRIDERLNDTKRRIEDIRDSISLINDIKREHVRRAHEQAVAEYDAHYPFMFKEEKEEDSDKGPTEMTLLEKLSQRSDAGLLADKFTNFLKTNSLQK